jgi:hypothetical protein
MTRSPGFSVRRPLSLLLPLAFGACTGSSAAPAPAEAPSEAPDEAADRPGSPPVLTSHSQLEAHVDRLVTIEGVVSETKIPTILGVDVEAEELGRRCRATGVLRKQVVTQEEIDERTARDGHFATRGPGTFYRLVEPDGGRTTRAEPLP